MGVTTHGTKGLISFPEGGSQKQWGKKEGARGGGTRRMREPTNWGVFCLLRHENPGSSEEKGKGKCDGA